VKVAVIQFEVVAGDIELNRHKAAQLIYDAALAGAQLILLPEYWPMGYAPYTLDKTAETMREGSVAMLRKLARELKVFIVGGALAEKKDGKYFITSPAINEAGEIIAKYRKAHLCPDEANYFSHGDEWTLAAYTGLPVGMMICYDIYFPEFARNLCLRGAALLTIPVLWEESSIERLHILAAARAVENHCFVMVANACKSGMAGRSLIISPSGRVLAQAGANETVLTAELDMSELFHAREHDNTLNFRRNILDEIDNSQL